MSKKKKKKKHFFLDFIRIVATIAVVIVVCGVAFLYVRETFMKKAGEQIMEYTIKSQAKDWGINSEQVDVLLKSIDDADKEIIENIVENHLNPEVISKGVELVKSGNEEGLRKLVENELSDNEINNLENIYNKYKGGVSEEQVNQIAEKIQNLQDTE